MRRPAVPLFVIAAVAVAADQATKAIVVATLEPGEPVRAIDGILLWTLQRNPGAAFGIFTRFPWIFTVLASVISVVIVLKARSVQDRLTAVALGFVLGGALGNLVDRFVRPPGVFRGHVIDFIDLRVWPVFNLADSCIVVGASLLVIAAYRNERAPRTDA